MSICDLLFSADLCVADAAEAQDAIERQMGPFGAARAQDFPDEGWAVVFGRVNKAMNVAPTLLEIIAPKHFEGSSGAGARVYASQAPRLWRSHATVVATPDIDALAERVRRAGLRHWLQPPAEDVPFARLWMGVADGDLARYQPEADGGFMFEFIPGEPPAFSAKQFAGGRDENPVAGAYERIHSRAFLVADLDQTLRHLERGFGWTPDQDVHEEAGYRFAVMSANVAQGARLRLMEARDPDSEIGRDYAQWGKGPYTITIGVHGLAAKADDLRTRGTDFVRHQAGRHNPERLAPILKGVGAKFELVDSGASNA